MAAAHGVPYGAGAGGSEAMPATRPAEGDVMIVDRATREHEDNQVLFRAVHEVAVRHAGAPYDQVISALTAGLPSTPRLTPDELRRIAEEITFGRDPSGL